MNVPRLNPPGLRPPGPPLEGPRRSEDPLGSDSFVPSAEPLRIWLVHGSYTGGHASAARSLEEALRRYPGVQVEVVNHADLSASPLPMSTAAEEAIKGGPVANAVRRWWFEENYDGNPVTGWLTDQAMHAEGFFADEFREKLQRDRPDLVVSTMSASTALLSHWRETGDLQAPLETVVTDLVAHQVWEQEGVDRYYVAHESTRGDLARFGADPTRVEVTGIPIRPVFAAPHRDRPAARAALGLDPAKPLVLLMGGSLGYADFTGTLEALDALPEAFQAAVIAGRNEDARKRVDAHGWTHPVRAEGYVANMADWIEAADVVVTAPGGLTTAEIMARGRAMVVPDPQAGLQGRNAARLAAVGGARVAHGEEGIAAEVGDLLRHPAARQALEGAALRAGHPDAAARIAGMLVADAARARQGA